MAISTVDLERRVYAAYMEVTKSQLGESELRVSEMVQFVADTLAFQLRTTVWSRHLGDHLVRYPADWWQAFKRRFFPAWALDRWPVLETVIVVQAYHEYPGLVLHSREPRLRYNIKEGGLDG